MGYNVYAIYLHGFLLSFYGYLHGGEKLGVGCFCEKEKKSYFRFLRVLCHFQNFRKQFGMAGWGRLFLSKITRQLGYPRSPANRFRSQHILPSTQALIPLFNKPYVPAYNMKGEFLQKHPSLPPPPPPYMGIRHMGSVNYYFVYFLVILWSDICVTKVPYCIFLSDIRAMHNYGVTKVPLCLFLGDD